MSHLLYIALGGAVGALLRYAVMRGAALVATGSFPYGTLAANLLGCFAIGVLWTLSERFSFPPGAEAFVFVGLLGAFTTFSTYGLDAVRLLRAGEVVQGALYLAASNLLGLGLVVLGLAAARLVLDGGGA
jgi:CrcB protein